jgi:ribonucleoside-diphosphate reductase alpha chain
MAMKSAESAMKLQWLPSGRGIKMSGLKYVEKYGSLALTNCAVLTTKGSTIEDLCEFIEMLCEFNRHGLGVGVDLKWKMPRCDMPVIPSSPIFQEIPITASELSDIIILIIQTHFNFMDSYDTRNYITPSFQFIDEKIRNNKHLLRYLSLISDTCESYIANEISRTRFLCDLLNLISLCLIHKYERGGLLIQAPPSEEFINMKNYEINPERAEFGWTSNNSILLQEDYDFEKYLPTIIDNIVVSGEPGIINMVNINNKGRYGHFDCRIDTATGVNLCGEIPLEPNELCNLSTTFPTNCKSFRKWHDALAYATVHATNVSLLPTHIPKTNNVIGRNRRIGVSIDGLAHIFDNIPDMSKIRKEIRTGYKIVRNTNKMLAMEAGVPESIRVTAIKPGGKTHILGNTTPGIHYPIGNYGIMNFRIHKKSRLIPIILEDYSHIEYEDDVRDDRLTVFKFPVSYPNVRSVGQISFGRQANIQAMIQKDYADNSVSASCVFDPSSITKKEIGDIITDNIDRLKSFCAFPISTDYYEQMPFKEISESEFLRLNERKND